MSRLRSRLTRSARLRLTALLDGRVAGHVYQMGSGRLAFRYEESWRQQSGAYPLSVSMPLSVAEHGDRAIRAFLWGLLPENPDVLEWWARRYGVSQYRVVDLLAHVGDDCAGAVQFAVPERVGDLLGTAAIDDEASAITWLDDEELEGRLRELRRNPAAGRAVTDAGQFSLAGAQPKTALYQDGSGRWGVPGGRMPTNRILKPPALGLDDLAYNEHFCLLLARELGFPAAGSSVQRFGDETAIVLERYDRALVDRRLVRIHQEDMCQALGIRPSRKYEVDGGPGVADIAELLRQHSSAPEEDALRFVDAIALNWLLAATDAHAKNYSILLATGPQLRLAPLYDVITVLPWPQLHHERSMLAMSVGGERRIAAIDATHWKRLARRVGVGSGAVVERVGRLATRIPAAVDTLSARSHLDAYTRELVGRLGALVADHARRCLARL